VPIADLARRLLDEPRWVETRWMLLTERAHVLGLSGDRRRFVALCTERPLLAVVGRPEHAFIAEAAARAPRRAELLAAEEDGDHVAGALGGWTRTTAVIHGWPLGAPVPEAPPGARARLLEPAEIATLTHVPRRLREEIVAAARYAPVAGAFAGGAPVAFCHASGVTETLWDVSIETLEGFRRRGLGTLAWRRLAAHYAEQGKAPVWGAAVDNAPSLAMAARLGFVARGRLALFER
jgi:GNAT superfamily N-acetyltransferase